MNQRTCRTCHEWFEVRYGFETRCLSCYIEWKRASEARAYRPPPPRSASIFPPEDEWRDMLPRLIRLAHPDRHENSEASNVATQWLLRQRDRLRAA